MVCMRELKRRRAPQYRILAAVALLRLAKEYADQLKHVAAGADGAEARGSVVRELKGRRAPPDEVQAAVALLVRARAYAKRLKLDSMDTYRELVAASDDEVEAQGNLVRELKGRRARAYAKELAGRV